MAFYEELISIIGKHATSEEVKNLLIEHALLDLYEDPPFRRYVGSSSKGVDILFDNDVVIDIQIFVEASQTHSSFSSELPFGIKVGMTEKDIVNLLGEPDIRDLVGSKYTMLNRTIRLTVVYDNKNIVSYLSMGES